MVAEGAFYVCYDWESVTIPDSVTDISIGAFYGWEELKNIEVSEGNSKYSSKDGVLFNKDKTELITYPSGKEEESYSIPESVTSIGSDAFGYCAELFTIYASAGSYGAEYANSYDGISFAELVKPSYGEAQITQLTEPAVFAEDNSVTVPVNITSTTSDGGAAVDVYVASYKDGVMTGIKAVKTVLTADGYNKRLIISNLPEKPDHIKIFAFDGADGMTPLCETSPVAVE